MCEATTIALVAVAAFSGYAAYQGGQNAQAQANYSARVAEENAKNAEIQAKDAESRGADSASEARQNWMRANATARANAASAGLIETGGTIGQLQDQNTEIGEANVLTIRDNANKEAWGYRVQSSSYVNQAAADKMSGKVSAQNGLLTGIGTFAQGAVNAGSKSKWLQKQFGD